MISKKFDKRLINVHSIDAVSDKNTGGLTMPEELTIPLTKKTSTGVKEIQFPIKMFDSAYKDIIIGCWHVIKWRCDNKKNENTTLGRFEALKRFIPFLDAYATILGHPVTFSDMETEFFKAWGRHIKLQSLLRLSVSHIGSLCVELEQLGYLPKGIKQTYYPRKTHRNINSVIQSETPFSVRENRAITHALRDELKCIDSSNEPLSSDELAICIMTITQVLPVNPTPLLEANINCLEPHPFDNNKQVLVVYKRRGDNVQTYSAKYSDDVTLLAPIGFNVVNTIEIIKKRNANVRNALPTADRHRLLSYVSKEFKSAGDSKTISLTQLYKAIKRFVSKHKLKAEDGSELSINLSRFRQTYLSNIFKLSGYNTALTAKYGKHDIKTANMHYRSATPEARQDYVIAIESICKELSTGVATSAASCSDNLYGEGNREKGQPCLEILGCFRCKNMVVTKADLSRLLSFKWAIIRERDTWLEGKRNWKKRFRDVTNQIDIIMDEYQRKYPDESDYVDQLKLGTKKYPDPEWRDLTLLKQHIAAMRQIKQSQREKEVAHG